MREIWKVLDDYPEYEISNYGNVFSNKRNKYLKLCPQKGYRIVCLLNNHKQYVKMVHKLVALAFIPNPHNYLEINHIDGNKANNNVNNLEWCNHLQNMQHAMKNQLVPAMKGISNGRAILTDSQVIEIYKLKGILTGVKIAKKYNISTSTVSSILKKKTWKHILD